MHTTSRSRTKVLALAIAIFSLAAVQAEAKDCEEVKGASVPSSVKSPRELQANAKHPALAVMLDGQAAEDGAVTLPVKDGKRIASSARDKAATAEVSDPPQLDGRDLDADIEVSATPAPSGTSVVTKACITSADVWKAGRYEGSVKVFGPRFEDFSYAFAVTQKWPAYVPIIILAAVLLAFGFFELRRTETGKKGDALFLAIGLAGGFFAYLQYSSSDTWGADWTKEIGALAAAAITAAGAARAAAKRAFGDKS